MTSTFGPGNSSNTARRVAVLISVLLCFLMQFGLLWQLREWIRAGNPDFVNFYTAGKIVVTGNGYRLYDSALQAQIEASLAAHSSVENFLPFVHPPFFALWMAPLSVFSYPVAFCIWWCCNLICFWVALWALDRALGGLALSPISILCAGLLFLPLHVAFVQGQDAVLSLLLFSLTYLFLSRGQDWLAGAVLGLAAYKPQLALILLVLLLLTRPKRLRLAGGFLLSCLGQGALAAAVLGWRVVVGYPVLLANFASSFNENRFNVNTMPNLRGVLHVLLSGRLPHAVLTAATEVLSALLVLAAIWALRSRTAQQQRPELRYALMVASTSLAAYYGFFHDMTLALLPLLITWRYLTDTGLGSLPLRLLAVTEAALFLGVPLILFAPHLVVPVLGCTFLCFWGLLLWHLCAQAPYSADPSHQPSRLASSPY